MASNVATNLVGFILVLGVLIYAHEAGHFIFAKLFRVRVLVFSFGFGKRLFGFRGKETDYRVSLIPLGGYVRMAGDTPEDDRAGSPDEYLSRPRWQRFLILLAGPGANLLIAILFLTILNMSGIEELRESRPLLGEVMAGEPAHRAGLRAGDLIVAAGGESIRTWDDLKLAISLNPATPVKVEFIRNGSRQSTTLVPKRIDTDYGSSGQAGVRPFLGTEIGRVEKGSAADRAGLREGDRIAAVNGQPVRQMIELESAIAKEPGRPVRLTIARGASTFETTLPPMRKDEAPGFYLPSRIRTMGFGEAFNESLEQNWKMVKYTFHVIGRLFKSQGSVKDFSGPISIARISGEMLRTGWRAVVVLMASISLQLGIMNLLPIPVLDGGHIAVLLVESVTRHELSITTKERIQRLGFAVLAALMIVVLFNDVLTNVARLTKG